MPRQPVLTERSASLLEADPRLAGVLIAGGASGLAHKPLLPVLALDAGDWETPKAAALGPQTASLVILAGWLCRDRSAVSGPGDAVDPWSEGGAWRACTAVRLVVIGAAFAAALDGSPDTAGAEVTPRAPALRLAAPHGGPPEERLLGLLWRLAARWGGAGSAGPALPLELDTRALAELLDVPRVEAEAALAALMAGGALSRGGDGGWQLPPPVRDAHGPHGLRDQLRARVTEQLVLARALSEDTRALTAELSRATGARRRSA